MNEGKPGMMDEETGLSPNELLDAQTLVWNHAFNVTNTAALNCVIELDIPEMIHRHGKPMTAAELTAALSISHQKTSCLHRIMRLLTHNGFFTCSDEEAYSLTNASKLLLKDHPFSAASSPKYMMSQALMAPLVHLSEWFQKAGEATPFQMVHGCHSFWDYLARDAKFGRTMGDAMAKDSRLVASVLVQDYRWVFEGVKTFLDVGGRLGIVGSTVAEAFPEIEVSVLDLPDVVAGKTGGKNFKYVGGSMFDEIPPADAIFYKWVLIDWPDEAVLKTLKRCREAISKNGKGKVIIVEDVLKSKEEDEETIETQLMIDIVEMITLFGKVRSEKEWAQLFSDAGFSTYKITPISNGRSLIEVFP